MKVKGRDTLKAKRKTIWVILAAVIAIWIAFVAVYWDVLVMYIAPQIPLGTALETACSDLEARYQESPIPIFLRGYDETGRNTVSLELRTKTGAVPSGELTIQSQLEENRLQMDGKLPEETKLGNISLYMDRDFAALTSDTLLRSGYYGITYDTFAQDLRSIPLVSFLVPSEQIAQWEGSLGKFQEKMSRTVNLPPIPEIPFDLLKKAPLALWVLRGKVTVQTPEINGEKFPCYQVVYRVDEETAKAVTERLAPGRVPSDSQVTLTCWLHEEKLVYLKLDASAGESSISVALTLIGDARTGDITVEVSGSGMQPSTISIRREGEWETIRLGDVVFSCQWNPGNGQLALKLPEKEAVSLRLSEAEKGFRLESPELGKMLGVRLFDGYDCSAVVTRGAEFATPDFKNLDRWSLEDLGIFLTGVWSVIKP